MINYIAELEFNDPDDIPDDPDNPTHIKFATTDDGYAKVLCAGIHQFYKKSIITLYKSISVIENNIIKNSNPSPTSGGSTDGDLEP